MVYSESETKYKHCIDLDFLAPVTGLGGFAAQEKCTLSFRQIPCNHNNAHSIVGQYRLRLIPTPASPNCQFEDFDAISQSFLLYTYFWKQFVPVRAVAKTLQSKNFYKFTLGVTRDFVGRGKIKCILLKYFAKKLNNNITFWPKNQILLFSCPWKWDLWRQKSF